MPIARAGRDVNDNLQGVPDVMIHLLDDGDFVPILSEFRMALHSHNYNGDEDAKKGIIENRCFSGQFDSRQEQVNPIHCGKGHNPRSDGEIASTPRNDSSEH
jgi:hypothetical protein